MSIRHDARLSVREVDNLWGSDEIAEFSNSDFNRVNDVVDHDMAEFSTGPQQTPPNLYIHPNQFGGASFRDSSPWGDTPLIEQPTFSNVIYDQEPVEIDETFSKEVFRNDRDQLNEAREAVLVKYIKKQKARIEQWKDRYKESQLEVAAAQATAKAGLREQPTLELGRLLGGKVVQRAQRDLEARKRDELRRMNMAGQDDDDFEAAEEDLDQSPLARLKRLGTRIRKWISAKLPLNEDLRVIEARYGVGVQTYYRFFRWSVLNMWLLALMWGPVLVLHIIYVILQVSEGTTEYLGISGNFFPLMFRYGSFVVSEGFGYSITLLVFTVIAAIATVFMLKGEDSLHRQQGLLDNEDGRQYARTSVVRLWDFQVIERDEVEELKAFSSDTFNLLEKEESIAQMIKNRTAQEKLALLIRRIIVNICVCILVLTSWSILIAVSVLSPYLGQLTYFGADSSFNSIIQVAMQNLLVPAALQILNGGAPMLMGILTRLEKWDSQAFSLKMLILRIFLIKILNVIIVMVSYMQLLLVGTVNYDWFSPTINIAGLSISLATNDTNSAAEDTCGEGLLLIILVDFVANKAGAIAGWLLSRAVARIRILAEVKLVNFDVLVSSPSLRRKPPHLEFTMQDQFVGLLIVQCEVWVCSMYYPFVAWIAPILFLISFKWDKFFMMNFTNKGEVWGAKDLGRFFMILTLVTYALFVVMLYYFLVVITHKTGPHLNDTAANVVMAFFASSIPSSAVYSVVTNGWVLWLVILCLISFLEVMRNGLSTLEEIVVDKQQHHQTDVQMYGTLIRRLRNRVTDYAARLKEKEEDIVD